MNSSRSLLIDGESLIMTMRTHSKAVFVPFLLLIVIAAVTGFAAGFAQYHGHPGLRTGAIVVGLALIAWRCAVPFLRWLTWTYTITDRRLIEQRGVFTRTGRVIPLNRVTDISFAKSLGDRILGCGTLIIYDASEQSGLEFDDVPNVNSVHRSLSQLVLDAQRAVYDERR